MIYMLLIASIYVPFVKQITRHSLQYQKRTDMKFHTISSPNIDAAKSNVNNAIFMSGSICKINPFQIFLQIFESVWEEISICTITELNCNEVDFIIKYSESEHLAL